MSAGHPAAVANQPSLSIDSPIPPLQTQAVRDALARWDERAAGWRLRPLVVTATLGGTVAYSRVEEVSLDGILASAALLEVLRGEYFGLTPPESGGTYIHVRLPLAVQGPEAARVEPLASGTVVPVAHLDGRAPEGLGWWWWACGSAEEVGAVVHDTHHFHKRFDLRPDLSDHLTFGTRPAKVQLNGGRFKSWRRPVSAQSVWALRWHVRGDLEAIEALLRRIPALGRHRAQGYGPVAKWEVEEEVEDRSLWTAMGGFARPVPLLAARAVLRAREDVWRTWRVLPREEYVGYRVPRWLPQHQTTCLVLGAP